MRTIQALLGLGLVALVLGSDFYNPSGGYGGQRQKKDKAMKDTGYSEQKSGYNDDDEEKPGFRGGRYYYGGVYRGTCYNDGLYYMDDSRFVICSNGNAYMQPCAPGTRNSGQHRYSPGYYYGYSDFCDINLVDQGYGPVRHLARYGPKPRPRGGSDYSRGSGSSSYGAAPSKGYNTYQSSSYDGGYDKKESYSAPRQTYQPPKQDSGYESNTDTRSPTPYKPQPTEYTASEYP